VSALIVPLVLLALFVPVASVQAATIPNTGFEDGTFTGWSKGSQSGTLGSTITGNGSGVTIFTGSRTFTHGSRSLLEVRLARITHQQLLLEVGHSRLITEQMLFCFNPKVSRLLTKQQVL